MKHQNKLTINIILNFLQLLLNYYLVLNTLIKVKIQDLQFFIFYSKINNINIREMNNF